MNLLPHIICLAYFRFTIMLQRIAHRKFISQVQGTKYNLFRVHSQLAHENAIDFKLTLNKIKIIKDQFIHTVRQWRNIDAEETTERHHQQQQQQKIRIPNDKDKWKINCHTLRISIEKKKHRTQIQIQKKRAMSKREDVVMSLFISNLTPNRAFEWHCKTINSSSFTNLTLQTLNNRKRETSFISLFDIMKRDGESKSDLYSMYQFHLVWERSHRNRWASYISLQYVWAVHSCLFINWTTIG